MRLNKGIEDIAPYVSGTAIEIAQKKYGIKKWVKMNSNENPLGPSKKALQKAIEAAGSMNLYPESSNLALREKISQKFDIPVDMCTVGNGADEIIYYIAMGFLNDGDEVIIPEITFPIYEIAAKIMRANIVKSRMKGYEIDLDSIVDKISDKTRMVFLANPNNPTGHAFNHEKIERFIAKLPESVLLVHDEAYGEFADTSSFPNTVSLLRNGVKNLIAIRTLSKAYGFAGLRLGYCFAFPGVIDVIHRIKLPFNISIITQKAAEAAIDDEEFIEETLSVTRQGRDFIYRVLDELGLGYVPSSTNFILIDTGRDSAEVVEELMKMGILVRGAANYGYPTCIRVTVGTHEDNVKFIEALKKLYGR